jgi:hypothetical protein
MGSWRMRNQCISTICCEEMGDKPSYLRERTVLQMIRISTTNSQIGIGKGVFMLDKETKELLVRQFRRVHEGCPVVSFQIGRHPIIRCKVDASACYRSRIDVLLAEVGQGVISNLLSQMRSTPLSSEIC